LVATLSLALASLYTEYVANKKERENKLPTPTYTPLATVTLGGTAASVTFSSIPATYRDLIVVVNATGTTGLQARMRFNSDSGSNYSFVRMGGDTFGAASSSGTDTSVIIGNFTGTPHALIINIMDYSATDKHKTVISRSNVSSSAAEAFANRWANTAAITSVQVNTSTSTWAAGSTFSLYGVIA